MGPAPLDPGSSPVFEDVDPGGVHTSGIAAIRAAGITMGCSAEPLLFCPGAPVTRAQMATFLARALVLPLDPGSSPVFEDVDPGGVHASGIGAIRAAGITLGCSTEPLLFCPRAPVTRAQMATFLARALVLPLDPGSSPVFEDVDPGGVHASGIGAIRAAGITLGCSVEPLLFCPGAPVTRAQMATFLARALALPPVPSSLSRTR